MPGLIDRIAGLSDSELAEAGILLLSRTMKITSQSEARERLRDTSLALESSPDELWQLSNAIADDHRSYPILIRTMLYDLAAQQPDAVEHVIASVGRKQMIPDLGLVVTLSVITLLMTRKTSTDIDIEVEPDGKRTHQVQASSCSCLTWKRSGQAF